MKTIITLSVLQLIFILFLLLKVMSTDGQTVSLIEDSANADRSAALEDMNNAGGNTDSFNEDLLRRIVREELRAQLDRMPSQGVNSTEEIIPDTISQSEYQYRLDAALQNLDYYVKQGEISDAEMAELQMSLISLDQEGRRQILSLLSKALSSGELKGNF